MPKKCIPTMKWEEAPEIIEPKHLAQIRGCCLVKAKEEFRKKGFPLMGKYVADKKSVMMFYGISNVENSETNDLLLQILQELKLRNKLIKELV